MDIIQPRDLVAHCRSESCKFCRERRARARARSIADLIAAAKPSVPTDFWAWPQTPRIRQRGIQAILPPPADLRPVNYEVTMADLGGTGAWSIGDPR